MKIIEPNQPHHNLFKKEVPPFIMRPTEMPRIAKTGAKLIEIGNKPIHLSQMEFSILSKIDETNFYLPEFKLFLERKGIPFDNGFVHVKITGKNECLMNTKKEDFGTLTPLPRKLKSLFPRLSNRPRF